MEGKNARKAAMGRKVINQSIKPKYTTRRDYVEKNEFLTALNRAFEKATEKDFKAMERILHAVGSLDKLPEYLRVLSYFAAGGTNHYDLSAVAKEIRIPLAEPGSHREFLLNEIDIDFHLHHLSKDRVLRVQQPHYSEKGRVYVDTTPLFNLHQFTASEKREDTENE